jgi:hypothetical protein
MKRDVRCWMDCHFWNDPQFPATGNVFNFGVYRKGSMILLENFALSHVVVYLSTQYLGIIFFFISLASLYTKRHVEWITSLFQGDQPRSIYPAGHRSTAVL